MSTTPQELVNFWQAVLDNDNGFTYLNMDSVEKCLAGPGINTENISEYIINPPKPKVKIIDLSMMIGSNIDMEFANSRDDIWFTYKLTKIDSEGYYAKSHDKYGSRCRIRQDHWHVWLGGTCPLPKGLVIEIKTRDNEQYKDNRCINYTGVDWDWNHKGRNTDIIAFKVIGRAQNWVYKLDV